MTDNQISAVILFSIVEFFNFVFVFILLCDNNFKTRRQFLIFLIIPYSLCCRLLRYWFISVEAAWAKLK